VSEATPSRSGRGGAGGALAAALEAGGFLAALAAANAAFAPEDPGLLGVSPHPLFAVVAVLALRHGAATGLAAGLVVASLHAGLQAWTAGGMAGIAPATPLLLLAAGAALGEVRSRDRARTARAREDARAARAERDALAARLAEEERARLLIERRALEPAARFAVLAEAARRIEQLEAGAIFPAVLEIAADHLQAESCAVYALDGGLLRLQAARGAARFPEERDARAGLAGLAICERRVASARDLGEVRAPGEPMLVAPILGPDGTPEGVLEVGSMPFVSLTASAERVAAGIAGLAARAARPEKALEGPAVAAREPIGLGDHVHLAARLAEEVARARRSGTEFAVVAVDIRDWERLPAEQRGAVRAAVGAAIRVTIRASDAAFFGPDERSFAALLPGTPADGARRAAARIEAALATLGLEAGAPAETVRIGLGVAGSGEAARDPGDLLAGALREARDAGGTSPDAPGEAAPDPSTRPAGREAPAGAGCTAWLEPGRGTRPA
jgi:GGDEF domain-containing protein/CRP-like cAMP-binding protein